MLFTVEITKPHTSIWGRRCPARGPSAAGPNPKASRQRPHSAGGSSQLRSIQFPARVRPVAHSLVARHAVAAVEEPSHMRPDEAANRAGEHPCRKPKWKIRSR